MGHAVVVVVIILMGHAVVVVIILMAVQWTQLIWMTRLVGSVLLLLILIVGDARLRFLEMSDPLDLVHLYLVAGFQVDKSAIASYIRLFEPLVIKSLKQYTVTSNTGTLSCAKSLHLIYFNMLT